MCESPSGHLISDILVETEWHLTVVVVGIFLMTNASVSFPVLIWNPLDEVSVQIFCLILDFFPYALRICYVFWKQTRNVMCKYFLGHFFCKPLNFWRKDRMKFVLPWVRQKVFTYNTKSIIHKIRTNNLGSVEIKPFWCVFLVLAWLR